MGALVASLLTVGAAASAQAASVFELEGQWAQDTPLPPDTVRTDGVVNARWWLNVNDDQPAPGNEPTDEPIVATVTATGAIFEDVPAVCAAATSSISSDGTVLTCDLGTRFDGSAITFTSGMRVTALSGEQVSVAAEIPGAPAVALPPLEVANPFMMDIALGANAGQRNLGDGIRDLRFNWTLFHGTDGPVGPASITYTVRVSNTLGAPTASMTAACGAFSTSSAIGHPWSGGSHPADQMAPASTCALTRINNTTYQLTITGLDYSKTQVPTRDSRGNALPTDRQAIASGAFWIRVSSDENAGSVTVQVDPYTYTAVDGSTSADDTANNTSTNPWTTGIIYGGWRGSASWSDTLRVAAGTEVRAETSLTISNTQNPGQFAGSCLILDGRYTTFTGARFYDGNNNNATLPGTIEYYTNTPALLNPASGSYDPNAWQGCGDTAGWSSVVPADLSTVRAVRVRYNPSTGVPATSRPFLEASQDIRPGVAVGQDVWMWSAYIDPAGTSGNWVYGSSRSMDPSDKPAFGVLTPGTRYPFATSQRDILRIIGVEPNVAKAVSPAVITPGETTATYTLTYSADGTGQVAPEVDGYVLTDVLPAGVTYVPGSASPAPVVTTTGGQQTLTWTLDDVPTNTEQTLTYDATFATSIAGGETLTNVVTATYGEVFDTARATVTSNDAGITRIVKTADQSYIPNVAGDGVGEGSWTVSVISRDPLPQAFTDTIDVLPYLGDGRGTDFAGSYQLSGPIVAPGATVYYTTTPPALLSDDPAHVSNGAAGNPSGNTVGWSTTFQAGATAVRVITGTLAPQATYAFTVPIVTDGVEGGDVLVNRAQGRAENTRLVMRTSDETTIANYYSADLKKYVRDEDGEWIDANEAATYPTFHIGDTVEFLIRVTNTGQGTLTDIEVSDDEYPELGSFTVDELAPGDSEEHVFSFVIENPIADTVVNTACAEAAIPSDSQIAPTIPCDPAGFRVVGDPTHEKELVSATPIGNGQWQLDYRLTVSNRDTPSTTYSLVDELRFTDQVEVVSAEVMSAPDGVELFDPAWDGQENVRIATNVYLAGNDDEGYEPHVYELRVIADAPLQLDGVGGDDDPTACGAEGSSESRAFTNTSTLTKVDGTTEEDAACAALPSMDIVKAVAAGPTPEGDGTWSIDYRLTVTNSGAGAGEYDLVDGMTPTGSLEVIERELTDAPEGVTTNDGWTGLGAAGSAENVIATGVELGAGQTHTYRIRVLIGVDTSEGVPVVSACGTETPEGSSGLSNTAQVGHNGLTDDDEACVSVAAFTIDKSIASGPTPNGDGTWTIAYDLVVENVGGDTGDYDLDDRLRYGEGIDVRDSRIVSAPEGVTPAASWTGQGEPGAEVNRIASSVTLAAGGIHTYRVEVTVELDEAEVSAESLACAPAGSGADGGLANSASVTHNGIVAEDEDCAGLPWLLLDKEIAEGPVANGDGTWTLSYDLTVTNAGSASGDYDLDDRLRYGDGIEIVSAAVVSSPDGVDTLASWTGTGAAGTEQNDIVRGQTLAAGEVHVYGVEVVVTFDDAVLEGSAPAGLTCPEPGSEQNGALANTAGLSHNGEDRSDDACATLPLIDIVKEVAGAVVPVAGQDGVYDVSYRIRVTNSGQAEGQYDLDDRLAPGEGVTVEEIVDVTSDVEGAQIDETFDGLDQPRLVTGQEIAAGATHLYTVVVRYSAALTDVELGSTDACTGPDGTVAGALHNVAQVSWNGIEGDDDACVRPGQPTLDKELVSAEPIGQGAWRVVYELTVGNVGGEATTYDLDDTFRFLDAAEVTGVSVAGPEGVTLETGFDGAAQTRIASDVALAGLDDEGYAPHVYTVAVTVSVPLWIDPTTIGADGTGSTACTLPPGSNGLAQGLNNVATLTDPSGGTQEDTACAELPSISIAKSLVGAPKEVRDGVWSIAYEIDVMNDGAAAGEYTLTDRLRYGTGITVLDVDVAGPDAVTLNDGFTGRESDGADATRVADGSLGAGETHTFTVTVTAEVAENGLDTTTVTCPSGDGADRGGFANTAAVTHNGLSAEDTACGVPDIPPGGLVETGSTVAMLPIAVGILSLLAGGLILVLRRRRPQEA